MQGNKACFLANICQQHGWQFTRFDYRGHGQSGSEFRHCTLDHWIEDACNVLATVCSGPQILVGSSMGAWIAVRTAMAMPDRVTALVGIAAAPDFTENLIWEKLQPAEREALRCGQYWSMPSNSDPGQDYVIGMPLIESGRRNAILLSSIPLTCPVRLLHGTADSDVPSTLSSTLLERLESTDALLTFKKNADHRFSDSACLQLLEQTLIELQSMQTTRQQNQA